MGERLTQTGIEGVLTGLPKVRSTRTGIEAVVVGSPHARFTQLAIEVVIANPNPPTGSAQFLNTFFPQVRGLTFPVMKSSEFSTIVQPSPNKYEVRVPNTQNPIWHWSLIYDYLKDFKDGGLGENPTPYTDYRYLRGFLLAQLGQSNAFLFNDPDDNAVGPALANQPWGSQRLYILGAIIVDPAGHAQRAVSVEGRTGVTIPTFNDGGGTTSDDGVTWQDLGVASGTQPNPAAQLQLLTDGTYWHSPIQRNFGGWFLEDVTDLNQASFAMYVNGLLTQSTAYQILGPGLTLSGTKYYGAYVRFFQWRPFTTYSMGDLFIDPSGHLQQATGAGTTGSLSPAWNDSGGTTLDGSLLWQDMGSAATITASFTFYFRARLESDSQDIEQFMAQLWTIGGSKSKNGSGQLRLRTARPNPQPPPACEVYPWNL